MEIVQMLVYSRRLKRDLGGFSCLYQGMPDRRAENRFLTGTARLKAMP